jgi:hypothetical protein
VPISSGGMRVPSSRPSDSHGRSRSPGHDHRISTVLGGGQGSLACGPGPPRHRPYGEIHLVAGTKVVPAAVMVQHHHAAIVETVLKTYTATIVRTKRLPVTRGCLPSDHALRWLARDCSRPVAEGIRS